MQIHFFGSSDYSFLTVLNLKFFFPPFLLELASCSGTAASGSSAGTADSSSLWSEISFSSYSGARVSSFSKSPYSILICWYSASTSLGSLDWYGLEASIREMSIASGRTRSLKSTRSRIRLPKALISGLNSRLGIMP